jgi:hypothetical protein
MHKAFWSNGNWAGFETEEEGRSNGKTREIDFQINLMKKLYSSLQVDWRSDPHFHPKYRWQLCCTSCISDKSGIKGQFETGVPIFRSDSGPKEGRNRPELELRDCILTQIYLWEAWEQERSWVRESLSLLEQRGGDNISSFSLFVVENTYPHSGCRLRSHASPK